jgi:hypothetical protein
MEDVVNPIVPVDEIVIFRPPEYPMFVRAEEVEERSDKLLAIWR